MKSSRVAAALLVLLACIPASFSYSPCLSCQVDGAGCTYCLGKNGDIQGAKCRTGGQLGCPILCMAEDPCGPSPPRPFPLARLMIGIASGAASATAVVGDQGETVSFPYSPLPWSDLTLYHAEIIVVSEAEWRDLKITDGKNIIGIGVHPDLQLQANRKIEFRDARGDLLFQGSFEPGTRLAVPLPGSDLAIVFEWRPMLQNDADEMATQRQFFHSLQFGEHSTWSAVDKGWSVQGRGGKP